MIVGIAQVASSGLFGVPTLYTTYNRALQYIPNTRFTISYLLVEPKTPADVASIKQQVAAAGYLALTKDEFIRKISDFYKYKTGIGTNMLIMTVISFIVGLSISGQTFYTFVLENLEKFGALKAIGAKGRELILMILFQAGVRVAARATASASDCARCIIWLARAAICRTTRRSSPSRTSGLAFVMVVVIAGDLQLRRRAQGAAHRTVRHLPGLDHGDRPRSRPLGLNKWFGEGEARTHAVQGRELRGLLRRDPLRRRAVGQRQDHHAQHDLGHSAPQQRHGEDRGFRHLESRQRCARRIPPAQDRLRVSGLSPLSAPHHRGECGDSAHPAEAQLGRGAQGSRGAISRSSA